jgi:hypothetical protein
MNTVRQQVVVMVVLPALQVKWHDSALKSATAGWIQLLTIHQATLPTLAKVTVEK